MSIFEWPPKTGFSDTNFFFQVGSRRVVQVGGILMILLGCLGKFGALFVTIPDPVVGGVFMVTFGILMGLVVRKPVFGVSIKASFKLVSSATETSKKI